MSPARSARPRRVFQARGKGPGLYVASVPIQTRKRGARGPLFHNQVTVFFFGAKRETLGTIESAAAAIKSQFAEMSRARLDESFTTVLELMMRLPSWLFLAVVAAAVQRRDRRRFPLAHRRVRTGDHRVCRCEDRERLPPPVPRHAARHRRFFRERDGRVNVHDHLARRRDHQRRAPVARRADAGRFTRRTATGLDRCGSVTSLVAGGGSAGLAAGIAAARARARRCSSSAAARSGAWPRSRCAATRSAACIDSESSVFANRGFLAGFAERRARGWWRQRARAHGPSRSAAPASDCLRASRRRQMARETENLTVRFHTELIAGWPMRALRRILLRRALRKSTAAPSSMRPAMPRSPRPVGGPSNRSRRSVCSAPRSSSRRGASRSALDDPGRMKLRDASPPRGAGRRAALRGARRARSARRTRRRSLCDHRPLRGQLPSARIRQSHRTLELEGRALADALARFLRAEGEHSAEASSAHFPRA